MENKITFLDILLLALFVLISFIEMNSTIARTNFVQIVFGAWFGLILIALPSHEKKFLVNPAFMLFWVFMFFYGISIIASHNVVYTLSAMIGLITKISPIIMFVIFSKKSKKLWLMLLLSIGLIIVYNIATAQTYLSVVTNANGLRNVNLTMDTFYFANSFNLVYSLAIITPTILFIMVHLWDTKYNHKLIIEIICIVSCIYLFMFEYKSSYMTALIILTIGVAYVLISKSKRKILTSTIVILSFVTVFFVSFDSIVSYTESTHSDALTIRLYEVKNILTGKQTEDYAERANLRSSSIETFISSPLIGVQYKSADFSDSQKYGIGNHSEWTDMLGLFGLFAFLLYGFILKIISYERKIVGYSICFFLYLAIGFANPVFNFFNNCVAFLLTPLMLMYFLPTSAPRVLKIK